MRDYSDDRVMRVEENVKARETIDRMQSVKRIINHKAVVLVPFFVFGLILLPFFVLISDLNPGWAGCFMMPVLWGVVTLVKMISGWADIRIKRCEDYLLSGIKVQRKKSNIFVRMMRNNGLIRLIGVGILHSCAFITIRYLPFEQWTVYSVMALVLIGFGFFICIVFVDKILGNIWVAAAGTVADLIVGSAPLWYYLLFGFGMVLFAGSFLVERFIPKKLEKTFGQEAENRIKPELETIMTVKSFDTDERLPYVDFGGGENYEGNCLVSGKWNGTDVAFSNISFMTEVLLENEHDRSAEPVYGKERITGICVYYTVDRDVVENMLEIVRNNLRVYQCYDVLALRDHKISVTLKQGYYFVESKDVKAVCSEDQLKCDAIKLNGVLEAIKAGIDHKELEP